MTFLNEATLEELLSIPGCSKKKATQLSELRPFKDWAHLVGYNRQAVFFFCKLHWSRFYYIENTATYLVEIPLAEPGHVKCGPSRIPIVACITKP